MTKTVCDICGKEMPTGFGKYMDNLNFSISSHGRTWDICAECRDSLNKWITERKANKEEQ